MELRKLSDKEIKEYRTYLQIFINSWEDNEGGIKLEKDFNEWLKKNNLPKLSADDLLAEINEQEANDKINKIEIKEKIKKLIPGQKIKFVKDISVMIHKTDLQLNGLTGIVLDFDLNEGDEEDIVYVKLDKHFDILDEWSNTIIFQSINNKDYESNITDFFNSIEFMENKNYSLEEINNVLPGKTYLGKEIKEVQRKPFSKNFNIFYSSGKVPSVLTQTEINVLVDNYKNVLEEEIEENTLLDKIYYDNAQKDDNILIGAFTENGCVNILTTKGVLISIRDINDNTLGIDYDIYNSKSIDDVTAEDLEIIEFLEKDPDSEIEKLDKTPEQLYKEIIEEVNMFLSEPNVINKKEQEIVSETIIEEIIEKPKNNYKNSDFQKEGDFSYKSKDGKYLIFQLSENPYISKIYEYSQMEGIGEVLLAVNTNGVKFTSFNQTIKYLNTI